MERNTYKIDAEGKVLGKLAVQISVYLRGKHKPDFMPNKDMGDFVEIKNADKVKLTGKKIDDKIYYRHTGYIGGLKKSTPREVMKKNQGRVLRMAVWGMMPKNKLRNEQIKRLKLE